MDARNQMLDGLVRPHRLLNAAFAVLLAVMAGHEAEHVAQVAQKNMLGRDCPAECRGLLGFIFDLEWIHMAYNASILAALLGLLMAYRLWRPEWHRAAAMCWGCLVAGIAVQCYHVVEHTAKIAQWATNGHVEPTPGILGQLLPPPRGHDFSLIELHFTFNTVVFVLVVAGFFGLGIARHAVPRTAVALAGRWRGDVWRGAPVATAGCHALRLRLAPSLPSERSQQPDSEWEDASGEGGSARVSEHEEPVRTGGAATGGARTVARRRRMGPRLLGHSTAVGERSRQASPLAGDLQEHTEGSRRGGRCHGYGRNSRDVTATTLGLMQQLGVQI